MLSSSESACRCSSPSSTGYSIIMWITMNSSMNCISISWPGKDGVDAHILRSFSFRSSLFTWLNRVAIRFFIRNKNQLIGNTSSVSLYSQNAVSTRQLDEVDAQMQVEQLFLLMKQGKRGQRLRDVERYILVIRRLDIEGCSPQQVAEELQVRIEAVYNIRTRAMKALRRTALKEEGGR